MTAFWILGALGVLLILVTLIHEHGYSKGKQDGQKTGYQEGFGDAHNWSELWWQTAENDVRQTRERIRNEEGWP
jgi:flagellar biosynthesis/type III secretory pathway protein FliH